MVISYTNEDKYALNDWLATTYLPDRVTIITYRLKFKGYFPINKLRNLGIQHIQTTHYMVLDIDLMVSSMFQIQIFTIYYLLIRKFIFRVNESSTKCNKR